MCARIHHQFDFEEHPVGGAAIDVTRRRCPTLRSMRARRRCGFSRRGWRNEVGLASGREAAGKWVTRVTAGMVCT